MNHLKNLGISIAVALGCTALGAIAFHITKDIYKWFFGVAETVAGIAGIFMLEVAVAFVIFTAIDWDKKSKLH